MTLAVLQSKVTIGNSVAVTFVMGSAPTNGNLLVCLLNTNAGAATAATGWTVDTNTTGNLDTMTIITKVAGAGESTSQTPVTGTPGRWDGVVFEISGTTGTAYATLKKHAELHYFSAATTSATGPSAAYSTGVANELVLVMGSMRVTSTANELALTGSGTWTSDGSTGASGGSTARGVNGGHQLYASSSSSVTFTETTNNSCSEWNLVMVSLGLSSSTESADGLMSFSGISFAATAGENETGTGIMSFSGISFNSAAGEVESGTGVMSFNGINFVTTAQVIKEIGTGVMTFHGIAIVGGAFIPSAAGTGLRQFWTT